MSPWLSSLAGWLSRSATNQIAVQVRTDGSLVAPLGQWLTKAGSDNWPSWYDPLTLYIYLREVNHFRRYRLAPDFALGFRNYTKHGVADSLPATCWRATAWINTQERLVVTGWTRYMDTPEETAPTNIDKARGQLPAEAQWAVEWLEQIGHLDYF
jgi:hypothetical protein